MSISSAITGSGPGGAIVRADVERSLGATQRSGRSANARSASISTPCERQSPPPWRDRSGKSRTIICEHQVDVTPCEQWIARANEARPPDSRLLMGALAVKSVALAARNFPAFNGFYRDGNYEPAAAVHVGVAIAIRGGGLAAPALHDTDRISLDQVMVRMRDLVQRTRAGRIRSSEMSDPTITVSSLGERGVEALYGIIYPPQVALIGFGKIVARPWLVENRIVARFGRHCYARCRPSGERRPCWRDCFSPRSASCCRSPRNYEQKLTFDAVLSRGTRQHRSRD